MYSKVLALPEREAKAINTTLVEKRMVYLASYGTIHLVFFVN
jgi:hypothetical protein